MEFLKVEHVLRKAVDEHRDFDNSAGWIQSLIMNLNITPGERAKFLNGLVEFLTTYPSGKRI